MKKHGTQLILSVVFTVFAGQTAMALPPTTEAGEISLSVGENHSISALGIKSYSQGSERIIEVRLTPDGKSFVVVGKMPGETTLLLIRKNGKQSLYQISVFRRAMGPVEEELSQLLEDDTGLRVRKVGRRIFIEGGVETEGELARVNHIASLYPGQVESLVVQGGTAAARRHNIRLDVFFVELSRSDRYQVGIQWPGAFGPGVFNATYDFLAPGTDLVSATASIVNQPLLGLDLAQTKGWAKVLKQSTVITANGVSANFSSGGSQNYAVNAGLTARLAQINYGTSVEVLPRYDPATAEVSVHVKAEMSELTAPVAQGTDLPNRNVTDVDTHVTLKLGQALLMSGIHTLGKQAANGGIPGLSQVPILGALFSSQSRNRVAVDGALFLIPTVIDAVPRNSRKLINELMEVYEDFGGRMRPIHLPVMDGEG